MHSLQHCFSPSKATLTFGRGLPILMVWLVVCVADVVVLMTMVPQHQRPRLVSALITALVTFVGTSIGLMFLCGGGYHVFAWVIVVLSAIIPALALFVTFFGKL